MQKLPTIMIGCLTKCFRLPLCFRYSSILIGLIFGNISDSNSQITKSGAVGNQTQEVIGGKVFVWVVPAEQKVRPEDQIENDNLIWSGAGKKIRLAAAANEHVPFQVVITTPIPEGRRPKAPEGFFIQGSQLTSQQGKQISLRQINFYLEHYIMLYAKSSPVGATGYWPDALAPIQQPFSMDAQYAVVSNRPVWVDLAIPPGTEAGIYSGTIKILQNGKLLETLTLEVEVYNFSLPEKTHLITYMNVSKGQLADFYNKPSNSPEVERLTQNYYEFLYAHRMEPWFNDPLEPEIKVIGEKVELKFDDARYEYYLSTLQTKRVLLNAYPSNLKSQIGAEPFTKSFNQKVKSYLSQVESYFDKRGWKDRLVFNSPIDEPNTKKDFEETREWAKMVHESTTGVPFLSTKSPLPDKNNQDWGTLRGHVDNFSIHGNSMNNPQLKQAILEEQAKGGEMTWYISCDQVYPQPNYFIDAPALDLVMVPWITARYNMDGILYWACNFWEETPNPWLDAVTFISGFVCSDGNVLNGEGSLLYPGDFTKQYTGQPNVSGPVSSIRFELLREGIEDYEYLWMLKEAGEKEFAETQVRNLVIDVSSFSRNLEELYATRRAMAKRLEKKGR